MRGTPALTRNVLGKGQAFFALTRLSPVLLDRFYAGICSTLSLPRALAGDLPEGVAAGERAADDKRFVILQNFTRAQKVVAFGPGVTLTDLESNERFDKHVPLEPLGSRVLRKHKGI